MEFYKQYIKGGEFLIAPSSDFKDVYLLKCNACDEYYSQFVTFLSHHLTHYNGNEDDDDPRLSPSGALQDLFGDFDEFVDVRNQEDMRHENTEEMSIESGELTSDAEDHRLQEIQEIGLQKADRRSNRFKENVVTEAKEIKNQPGQHDALHSDSKNVKSSMQKSETSNCYGYVYDLLKSRKNICKFILLYKNQPKLWNSNIPPRLKTKTERQRCLEQIKTKLKEDLNIDLTHKQIEQAITLLRRTYRQKLQLQKNKTVASASCPSSDNSKIEDFAEHLRFLKSFLEKNQLAVLDGYSQDLETAQIVKILDIYKRCPNLWKTSLIENYCSNKRAEGVQRMMKLIQLEMNIEVNENAIRKYIHCVNINFSREKRYSMGIALTDVRRSEYFEQMMFLYDHVGPFRCSSCRRVFTSLLQLKLHESEQHGGLPLTCSVCKKSYTAVAPYVCHIRRHMNDLNNSCEECGKNFLKPSQLKTHMRLHTSVTPYCCDLCGISFRHAQAFNIHRRRHEKKFLYYCPTCSKGFYGTFDMKIHIQTHNDERQFVCETCGKAFKSKKTMQRHGFTHEEGRNHKCFICNKGYKNKLNLKKHLKAHLRKGPLDPKLKSKLDSKL